MADADFVQLEEAPPPARRVPDPTDCSFLCPLGSKKGCTRVPGYFPTEKWCGLAFVGEQPWKEEVRAGFPFVGQSGKLLWSICKVLGIPQAEVLVLNAIDCFAGEWPSGKTAEKAAKGEARRACRPRLMQLLDRWQPRVIVALGGEAIRSLLDDEGASVSGYRGTVNRFYFAESGAMPAAQPAAWLTCAEHPAAILRSNGFTAPILKKDLAKAWRWLNEGAPRVWESVIEAAPSVQRTRELCALWRAAGHVTGDVETLPDGGRWHDKLRLIGLGDEDRAAWWPMFGNEWPEFYSEEDWLEVRAELRGLLADARVSKTFQNKQYDMAVLDAHGFTVAGLVEDTMVMHHVLHLRDVAHDLGYIGAEYLDIPAWKKEFKKEWNAPIRVLGEYNGNDVLVTARVQPRMMADLVSRGLMATYVMDRDGTDLAYQMNRNGIWVDEYRRQEYLTEYDGKAAELMAQTLELTGAADRQRETLELVADADIGRWGTVKLDDLVAGAQPDLQALIDACALVAGRLLQPKLIAEVEESGRKLAELAALDGWKPWEAIDPCGPTKDLKKLRKALSDEAGAATAGNEVEHAQLTASIDRNAAVRVAAGRACSVVRSAVGRVLKALSQPLLNPESGQQMGLVLHSPRWLGLPVAKPADTAGEYLTNEEALYHVSWHPAVQAWQGWGSAAYRAGWLRDTLPVSADGRAHGAFKTTRTPNARWAGGSDGERKWNPQNPEKATIDIFAAPPGSVLVGRDFSMIEIRVAAGLSGDKRMIAQINAFDEGTSQWDIHQQRAIRCWPDFPTLPPELQKKKRNLAKRANFGPIYGASKYMLLPVMLSQMKALESLEENNRRTDELLVESQRILDDIHADWAELFLWLEEGYRRAMREGKLQNGYTTGRTIHFPLRDRDHVDRRFCYNAPVQGCLPETTRIFTDVGLLQIGDAPKQGNVWTGVRWAQYTLLNRGVCELAEIELSNGQILKCDTRHEVLVEGPASYEFKKFSDLHKGDQVCLSLPQQLDCGLQELPDGVAYWMGYCIGNGSAGGDRWHNHQNSMGFIIGNRKGRYTIGDKLAELYNFLKQYGFHFQQPNWFRGHVTVACEAVALRALFEKYGYPWGCTAHTKKVPASIWNATLAQRRKFLIGLLDADGCVQPGKEDRGGANLHMCNERLLREVQVLFRSVGVRGVLRGPYEYTCGTSWRLDLNCTQLSEIGYGTTGRRAAKQKLAPRFVVEKFLQQIGNIPKFSQCASASDATLFSRMKHGGSTNVYVLAGMARLYLHEPFEMYDSEAVVATRRLGVVATTYTLAVEDEGHRFDSEGIISKNSAREIVLASMIRIDKRLPRGALWVMDAHDQCLIECPEEMGEEVHEIMKEEMQGWCGEVRILSDGGPAGGIAKTWKELK